MYQNTLTLNNGVKIQQLGLGTWFIPCLLYTSDAADE